MRKRLWDLAKSRIEIATILPGHRHKVRIKPLISCNAPSDLKSRPFSAFGAAVQSG